MAKYIVGILLLILAGIYISKQKDNSCLADSKCIKERLRNHPVRQLKFWDKQLTFPIEKRVSLATSEILDYLNLDNISNKYPNRPVAVTDQKMLQSIEDVLQSLPPKVKSLIEDKLLAVIPVKNLGTSAYTESVLSEQGMRHGFVVLDIDSLDKTANEWATWKEKMPFTEGSEFNIKLQIEESSANNKRGTLEFILLHELGHVLSIGTLLIPPWNIKPNQLSTPSEYVFFSESWTTDLIKDVFVSIFDEKFKKREEIIFYKKAKLQNSEIRQTYESLLATNFPTLYSSTNFTEDFAESFATYVHCKILKKPYNLEMSSKDKNLLVIPCCWDKKRCEQKQLLIERILFPSLVKSS